MSQRGQSLIIFWNHGFPSRKSLLCNQWLLGVENCHSFTAVTPAKHILSPQTRVVLLLEVGWGILAKAKLGLNAFKMLIQNFVMPISLWNCICRYLQPLALTRGEAEHQHKVFCWNELKVQTFSFFSFWIPKFCFPGLHLAFTQMKSLQRTLWAGKVSLCELKWAKLGSTKMLWHFNMRELSKINASNYCFITSYHPTVFPEFKMFNKSEGQNKKNCFCNWPFISLACTCRPPTHN